MHIACLYHFSLLSVSCNKQLDPPRLSVSYDFFLPLEKLEDKRQYTGCLKKMSRFSEVEGWIITRKRLVMKAVKLFY